MSVCCREVRQNRKVLRRGGSGNNAVRGNFVKGRTGKEGEEERICPEIWNEREMVRKAERDKRDEYKYKSKQTEYE